MRVQSAKDLLWRHKKSSSISLMISIFELLFHVFIYITFIISSGVPPSTSEPPLRRNPQLEFSPSRLISITETFSLFLRFPIMFLMVVLLFFSKICHCTISRFWRPIWKVAGRCFAHLFWAEKRLSFSLDDFLMQLFIAFYRADN